MNEAKAAARHRLRTVVAALAASALGVLGANAQEPVTIEFAAWQFTEQGRGEKLKAIVDRFMEEHPDIRIESVAIPFPQFETTIFTQVGQGGGPDVFLLSDDGFPKAVDAGFLVDLDTVHDWSTMNLTAANDAGIVDGTRYGLVWGGNSYNLIYNKELLETAGIAVPTSYEEFEQAAAALAEDDIFGYAFRATAAESAGMWYDVSNWVYGLGGRWADDGTPLFDSEPVVEAVNRLKHFYDSGYVPRGVDAATYRRMFWEGQIAFLIDNLAVPGVVAAGNEAMRDKIGIAPLPFESGDHASITTYVGINAHSDQQEAAATFTAYLFSDAQPALYEMLGGVTVGTDIDLSDDPLAETAPWLSEAAAAVKVQQTVSPVPEGLAAEAAELRTIFAVALEEVLFGDRATEEALADAQEQALDAIGR